MLYGLIALIAILWLQAIVDISKTTFRYKIYNILWICIVLFFPIIGSLVYFNLKKRNNRREFQPNFNSIKRPDRF